MPKVRDFEALETTDTLPLASSARRTARKGATTPKPRRFGLLEGEVVQVLGIQWEVKVGDRIVRCVLKRSRDDPRIPVVGDRVALEDGQGDMARIVHIEERRTVLRRSEAHRTQRDQVLVANVDQLLIVAAVSQPAPRAGLIDRYLVAAWRDGLSPLLCFNKVDLGVSSELEDLLATFEGVGIPVLRSSVKTGEGLDALKRHLEGKRTVLAGLSGVGKTSLTRVLAGDSSLLVGDISQATGRGMHCTTSARCLELLGSAGGMLIDLPGHRVFGLTGVAPEEVLAGFPEFAEAPPCLLPNCAHVDEEGCNLRSLVTENLVSPRRLEGYLRIRQELLKATEEELEDEE